MAKCTHRDCDAVAPLFRCAKCQRYVCDHHGLIGTPGAPVVCQACAGGDKSAEMVAELCLKFAAGVLRGLTEAVREDGTTLEPDELAEVCGKLIQNLQGCKAEITHHVQMVLSGAVTDEAEVVNEPVN